MNDAGSGVELDALLVMLLKAAQYEVPLIPKFAPSRPEFEKSPVLVSAISVSDGGAESHDVYLEFEFVVWSR